MVTHMQARNGGLIAGFATGGVVVCLGLAKVNVATLPRTHILLKQLNIKLNISENTTEDELIDELKVKEEQIFKWVVLQVITNLNLLGN